MNYRRLQKPPDFENWLKGKTTDSADMNFKNTIISFFVLLLCWNLPAQVRMESLNAFTTDTSLRLEVSLAPLTADNSSTAGTDAAAAWRQTSLAGIQQSSAGGQESPSEKKADGSETYAYPVNVSIVSISDGSVLWEGKIGEAAISQSDSPNTFNFTVDGLKPKLWSTVTPELYDVNIEICGIKSQTRVGFRHFEMKDGRFYLNGKPIFLRGNAINPPGRGIPAGLETSKEFARDYVRFLKGMNINIIRIPTNQNWLEVCDEEGMMVFGGRYGRPRNSISAAQPSTDIPSSVEYYKTNELGPLTPHPSVVIYVLSNEMPYSGETGELWHRFLEDCYQELVKWDSTRAYIGNAGYGLGKEADIYDVHRYWGWYYNTFLTFLNLRDGSLWENPGKIQAITFTECVGNYTGIDGAYNLCSRTKQPGSQKCWTGHSPAGDQPGEALAYQAFVLKNAVEMFRRFRPQNGRLAGVMPFTIIFHNWDGIGNFAEMKPKPAAYQYGMSYQPVLLSWENWKYNIYAGSQLDVVMHIVNDDDSCRDLENAEVHWRLVNKGKLSIAEGVEKLPAVPYYGTMSRKLSVSIPEETATGSYTLIGEILKGGKTISRNTSDVFIADKEWKQDCKYRIAQLSAMTIELGSWDSRKNAFDDITKPVLIRENSWPSETASADRHRRSKGSSSTGSQLGKDLADFINRGGRVLIMKQKPDFDTSWLPVRIGMLKDSNNSNEYLSPSYTYSDGMNINIEHPEHAIFKGMSKANFKLWSDCTGFDESMEAFPEIYPVTGGFSMRKADLTKAIILANYSRNLSGTALCEIFDGKGSAIMSGFDIESKTGTDPFADRLYANMLSYIVSEAIGKTDTETPGEATGKSGETLEESTGKSDTDAPAEPVDAYAEVGNEIIWGDFKSERGIVTGANNGLVLNTFPIVPEDQKGDCPIKVDSLGYQYVGSYGGWNSRPGIQYVPMGRRPFGPYEYTLGGSDRVSEEYAKEGSGYVAIKLPSDKTMMETTIWNPYRKTATISVLINGTEVSIAEIEPGQTTIISSSLPKTKEKWNRLRIDFKGSRYAVLMKTAFLGPDSKAAPANREQASKQQASRQNLFRGTGSVTAKAVASGEKDGYPASAAIDGKYTRDSRWISSGTAPHWLEVNLDRYCDIDSLVIKSGIPENEMKENESHQKEGFWCVKNFIIQYWDDANWTDIDETYTTENREDAVSFKLAKTVTSFRFRLKSTDGENIRIIEFEGWGKVNNSMPAPAPVSDTGYSAGSHSDENEPSEIHVRVLPEVVGKTMKYVAYNQGYFVPGNNAASWLEYSSVNAVRIWAESDTFVKDSWIDCASKPETEEDFTRLRESFLKDPVNAGVIDWQSIEAQANRTIPSTNTMSFNFALDEIHSIGADILIQCGFGKNRYDSSWTNKWQLWQKYYALAFYTSRRADVNMFAMKNEPNHRHAGPMPLDLFIELAGICSDAVHTAVNDVNRIYDKSLTPKFVGPVTAGTNTDWWAAVAANPGIFDLFSTHSYNLPAAGYEGRTAMIESVQKSNSPDHTSLPVVYTEIGRWMNAYLIDKEETMDSPSLFAEWAGIYTQNMLEGAYGMWAFKFANTASSTYPKGIKSGHHYTWKGIRFAEDSFENIALGCNVTASIGDMGSTTAQSAEHNSSSATLTGDLNGRSVAPTGDLNNSSSTLTGGYDSGAEKVTDGDKSDSSVWIADSDCEKEIVIDLGTSRSIAGLSVYSGSSTGVFTAPDRLRNFSIEFFNGVEWDKASRIDEKSNKYAHNWYLFDSPVTASKIRLTIQDKGRSIVREVKAFAPFDTQLVEKGCYDISGTQRTAQVVRLFAKGFKNERPLLKTIIEENDKPSSARNGMLTTDRQSDVCTAVDSLTNTAYIWLVHRGNASRKFDINLSALGIGRRHPVVYEEVSDTRYGDGGILRTDKKSSVNVEMSPNSVILMTVPLGKTIDSKAAATISAGTSATHSAKGKSTRTGDVHSSSAGDIHFTGYRDIHSWNLGDIVSMDASDRSGNRIAMIHFDGIEKMLPKEGQTERKYVLALSAHSSDGKPYRFHIYMKAGNNISPTDITGCSTPHVSGNNWKVAGELSVSGSGYHYIDITPQMQHLLQTGAVQSDENQSNGVQGKAIQYEEAHDSAGTFKETQDNAAQAEEVQDNAGTLKDGLDIMLIRELREPGDDLDKGRSAIIDRTRGLKPTLYIL